MSIHSTAAAGFDADAVRYARGRPDYPAALDGWLRDTLKIGPGAAVVDLGAGTGKFTRRLVATGSNVTAIEPVDAMRAQLTATMPAVRAVSGSAEAIPLPDHSVDAIVCAQAFHWFATSTALAEMHRVLRPGGRLGLVWNTRDDSVPWVKAIFDVIEPYEGDVPRFHSGAWRKMFPAAGFGPLHETQFPHGHTGNIETVIVDRLLSVSFIASLPHGERDALAARLRDTAASRSELADRAEITLPYVTHAYCAERL